MFSTLSVLSMDMADKAKGAVVVSAIGDALGRVTEFMYTTQEIQNLFGPLGLTSFDQFSDNIHWINGTALYTDDTVMAKLLLEEAIKGREKKFSINEIVGNYAKKCIALFGNDKYVIDPYYNVRAHGTTAPRACNHLRNIMNKHKGKQLPETWWNRSLDTTQASQQQNIMNEGGCGSVMRAWPLGLVFYNDMPKLIELADKQSVITHRNPMARAASIAIAVGTACAMRGDDVASIYDKMYKAICALDIEQHRYNNYCRVTYDPTSGTYYNYAYTLDARSSIANNRLSASGLLQYAYAMATAGYGPELILGTHNNRNEKNRSTEGFLLGWAADEALAAAFYIFVRNPKDIKAALAQAVNTPGDSDSIAALVGALVGAYNGISALDATGFDYTKLENKDALIALAEQSVIVVDQKSSAGSVTVSVSSNNIPTDSNMQPSSNNSDEKNKQWQLSSLQKKVMYATVIVGGVSLVAAAVYSLWKYAHRNNNNKSQSPRS